MNLKLNYKSIDFWFFTFLILLLVLPILAPIFTSLGLHFLAKPIYFVYSFFCHQFDTRSVHIFDHQYAWCARDFGIWSGVLAAAIGYKLGYFKQIKIWWLIVFILPIALDGGIQTISTLDAFSSGNSLIIDSGYFSNNLFRFVTGAWFGIGLSLFLTPNIISQSKKKVSLKLNHAARVLVLMIPLLIVYFVTIQVWALSSSEIQPTNIVDSVPKTAEADFFQRRKNGECPTEGINDILDYECFF